MKNQLFKLATTVLFLVAASYAGVNVSSPANGSTVGSPVHVVASASSANPIVGMKVYVDSVGKYSTTTAKVDTYLSLAAGTRYFTIQSWDSKGYVQKASFSVKVGSSTSTTTSSDTSSSTSNPKYSNIEEMSGWKSCDTCAGPGGTGPTIPYSLTQGITSPAMSGKSARFSVGGDTRYSQALWWRQLGGNNNVKNFVYDLYFYIKDPNAPQALEFDVNQGTGSAKYIFGTECAYKQSGSPWKVWDSKNAVWTSTGVYCPKPNAYSWNHVTLEFQRVGSQTRFVAVTLNGKKSYFNKYFYVRSSSSYEVNVAFQMDKNYYSTDYDVWLDKVSLNYW